MKIIIAGAGAVGTHLAGLLSREHHDITLIDESQEKLDAASGYDLLPLQGSPISLSTLRSADARHADILIGVTPDDAHNLTCCMMGHALGTRQTVARVDNSEYTDARNADIFKGVGIDSIIYPELLAAQELSHTLRHGWSRQWLEIQGGLLVLVGVTVREEATILDRPLRKLFGPEAPYHIVAVKRLGETIIPHGDDVLQRGDIVYFMTTPAYTEEVRRITGKDEYPDIRRAVIMGGGSMAYHVARLLPQGVSAKIIERDRSRCEALTYRLTAGNVTVLHGDGRDLGLLREENAERAQAFLALTSNSESNILACLAARRLGIYKTVAMVENTDYIGMAESLDIGYIINKKTFAADHIYRMTLRADVAGVKSLMVVGADVAEFVVSEHARCTRHAVKDLSLPSDVTLGGLIRDGRAQLISGGTRIESGDRVVVFCIGDALTRVEKFFK